MRVEPYSIDSYLHIMKRGARGMEIVRNNKDYLRFIRLLYYLNDEFQSDNWERNIDNLAPFERPVEWPERSPLVRIAAWTLMPNHFHLCLQEIRSGGISKFMQRLCGSMSAHFNAKYREKGSIFQGAFRSRTINDNSYLRHLAPYIMVKNVFELYPEGGLTGAIKKFEDAWRWAVEDYPFSSLSVYAKGLNSPIIERNIFHDIFEIPASFKENAREMILNHVENAQEKDSNLYLEEW